MRLVITALLTGSLIAMIGASCSTTDPTIAPPTGAQEPGGLDGTWVLDRGTHDGSALPIPQGSTIDMTLDGATAGGTAACNSWFGEVAVDGQGMSFSQLGQTEMACDSDRMEAESAYLNALVAVNRHQLDGDRLTLRGPTVELVFSRKPPVADTELVGTSWVLDTLVEGEAASSVRGEPAALVFSQDGTFDGGTGCRSFSGAWSIDGGGQLVITDLASDGHACEAPLARQDQLVLETLAGRVTAEIDGNRLTISGSQENGLGYRAG